MHKNNGHSSRSLYEQIEELKSKINLIEGDRKAYYESSQYAIKKNQKKVKSYRKETSELRRRLSDTLQWVLALMAMFLVI